MNIYFSENIKRFRKERDLTQEALADFLGVSFQTISKWERGESYPDLELLATIADFFSVSTDALLGVDKAKNEQEILALCEKFDKKQYAGSEGPFGYFMQDAYKKYPADFRIAVRYMQYLQAISDTHEKTMENTNEIRAIYNRIQNYCTDDVIRIHAKYLILHHYRSLAQVENSQIGYEDIYQMLETMPSVKETKDYLLCYMHEFGDKENIRSGCRNLIDKLIPCLDDAMKHYVLFATRKRTVATKEQIQETANALEKIKAIYNIFYPDEVYGDCWRRAIYTYGDLGEAYHLLGNNEKSLQNFRKCAELAKRFDTLPDEVKRHNLFFEGTVYRKSDDPSVYADSSLCNLMREFMLEIFSLSDEFKATSEFKEIIHIMQ
ncbi:MAG: helix-turn-helix transcriptional regulator [Eubacterium sp.]|nr:helix-turn-helix transcriptional regulator [Eubacterium sp.]